MVLARSGTTRTTAWRTPRAAGHGIVDLWTATEDSINVVFAQLIFDVGAGGRREHRRADDRDGSTNRGIPGGGGPRDRLRGHLARSTWPPGYQTIANDGRHCDPYTVQSIERDGKVLLEHERTCDPVLKAGDAHLITSMLEAVPVSGTAASAFGAWGDWPVAGKTGTAQENTNVWFGGYTKQFTTVVWVGSPGNPYSMGHVFGGTVAAPIWVAYMSRVMQGLPAIGFPEPPKPPEGPVPSVIGMNRKEAITTLSEAGFRASVEIVGLAAARRAQVFSQSPGGGSVTRTRHARVGPDLDRGAGAGPDASGRRDAWLSRRRTFLESLGLVVTTVRVETGNPDKIGFVIAQDRAVRPWSSRVTPSRSSWAARAEGRRRTGTVTVNGGGGGGGGG